MGPKRIVTLAVILAMAAGAYVYFSPSVSDQPDLPRAPLIDSIDTPERPTITAQKDTTPSPVEEKLSPGTAFIKAIILSTEPAEGLPSVITIRVEEVLGYGSATPPLPTGTELNLKVSGFLESNPSLEKQLQHDSEVQLVVASQQGLAVKQSDDQKRWSLVEIKE